MLTLERREEQHPSDTAIMCTLPLLPCFDSIPSQMPVVEFLVQRGANVNHSNATGNTPLHFAMSYDASGKMGEYLINNGADDTIENKQGLSPCEYYALCNYLSRRPILSAN